MISRLRVRPPQPYSLERTVARLVRFEEVVHRYEDGRYRRLVFCGGAPLRISVAQKGPASRAELQVELEGRTARSKAARQAAEQVLERVLGARTPVASFYRAHREDALLGEATRRYRGLRVAGSYDLWESLVTAVLSQQINLTFAYSIRADLARRYGRRARFDGETYLAFPKPERVGALPLGELRGLRLSGAKARTLQTLGRSFASGELDDAELARLPDEAVVERLVAVPGVGPWTAEIALMRGLARSDAFPATDLAVLKYLAVELLGKRRPASEAAMRKLAEQWRPHRALALAYLLEELTRRRAAKGGA